MNDADYDDDVTMESSTESVHTEYQKLIGYEKLLPYADELDEEAAALLADIKGLLGHAVMLRKISPTTVYLMCKLQKFITIYGYKFSKEDHIAFIKLIYELMTLPNREPALIEIFGNTFIELLCKPELISPEEMELPWEPLYKLVKSVLHIGQSERGIRRYITYLKSTLRSIVLKAKVYFPVSATQEILDELRPRLCPLDQNRMTKAIELMEMFLPLTLFPKDHHLGYKLWLDEILVLWETCHNPQPWEQNLMWLLGRVASENIGHIDWEPHVPLMFSRFVRSMHLPVFYKQIDASKPHKFEPQPIALWIVSTLGNGSSSQMYLEKFLKTIETYFHQANYGPWVTKLRDLLYKLSDSFILRVHKERYGKRSWIPQTPESHKLTDPDIDAFVKAVLPVAMTAMFSRFGVTDACKVLQNLAAIRPNLVIPGVIERMYSTLDSLTEPHKMTAVMLGMAGIVRPMLQGPRNINKGYVYSEGPSHILPLLFSFLPGIDANDTKKCFVTCQLMSVYAVFLPLVDSSRCTAPMDDDERLLSESTSRFEDFVLQFFDRIFSLIESSTLDFSTPESQAANGGKSKLEAMAEGIMASVCIAVLWQTDDTIFQAALHKLCSFVTDRIFETTISGRLAGVVCRVFARVNGAETLRALIPILSEMILGLINENEEIRNEENLDHRLLYAMLLMTSLLETSGVYLLPYMDTLSSILDKTLHLKSQEGRQMARKMLKTIFYSLSNISAMKFTTKGRDYNDPEYPYFRDWGLGCDISDVKVNWYVPGETEVATLQNLFYKFVVPEIKNIEDHTAGTISLTRDELLTSLSIVSGALEGSDDFFPETQHPKITDDSLFTPWMSFLPTTGVKGTIQMPDGGNVRDYLLEVMSKLQSMMLSNSEDDTKSLYALGRIWSHLLLGKAQSFDHFIIRSKNFKMTKGILKDKLVKRKGHLCAMYLVLCTELHHERRLQQRVHSFTEAHKRMIFQLFQLATSRYADVRSKAQDALLPAFCLFPYSHRFVLPEMRKILFSDPDENHEAHKGVLYLLMEQRTQSMMTLRDWQFLRSIWPALVSSKASEKLSVIRLKENIVHSIELHFPLISIKYEIPDSCVEAGATLLGTSSQLKVLQPGADEIEQGRLELEKLNQSNSDTYDGLISDLYDAITEGNPHWRHRLMGMSFIRDLVHPDRPYPVRVVRYFLNALINESLEERKIATKTVSNMLTQQKRKHKKIPVDLTKLQAKGHPLVQKTNEWYPGVRSDNVWLQYNYENRPLSEKQWNESRYVHETFTGYYTWPKKLEVYAPSSEQPDLDPKTRVLTEFEREVDRFFSDPQNVDKLIKYYSLEERKGKDKFNVMRSQLFKGLFRNHGIVHVKNFLPHLERLVADTHESSQRCAAEITSGLIKATKHWPYEMVEELWKSLTPIIRTALNNLTVETVADWKFCFRAAQEGRDPNRMHWLLECFMEEPPLGDSTTSFVQCGRLDILQTMGVQSWRIAELMERLIARVEGKLLTNPFQNVRGRLGSLLATIFSADLRFAHSENDRLTPRARDLWRKVMPALKKLCEASSNESTSNNDNVVLSGVANVKLDIAGTAGSIDPANNEQTVRLFKTIGKWIIANAYNSLYSLLPDFYEILPIVCQLESSETDEELSKICSIVLAVIAQVLTLPRDMNFVIEAVNNISRSTSWSSRASCLSFMEVFVFYNMSILLTRSAWVETVREIVLRLLEDERVEVREKAARVIGGLLHCNFIEEQEALRKTFVVKSKKRIHNRDDLRVRHAGVLGLCAFIQAHPYDVPKYVPSVFEHLGAHLSDPQPIPSTIRKTLGDFKRTHYDGWANHALQFTEEQLEILQDLNVPPSYYA